jgi:hypothetical protein
MDEEIDFYTEILEDYTLDCNSEADALLWMCYSIIRLLKITKTSKESDFLRNGLILILEHFLCFKQHYFEHESQNVVDLINNEKDVLLSALRQEFC